MPNVFVRVMLFVSSYFPLALIYGIFLVKAHPIWAAAVVLVGLLGVLILLIYFLGATQGKPASHETIANVQRHDGDIMSYIASYLIPFVTFPLGDWTQVAAIVIFLVVLLIVYVNSNMIYINPMLSILGYHLYEVEFAQGKLSHYLISARRLWRDDSVYVIRIGDGMFLEKRKKDRADEE